MPLRRRPVAESGRSRFVGPHATDAPLAATPGRARRAPCVLHLSEITSEEISDTLFIREGQLAAGGPLATGRYVR